MQKLLIASLFWIVCVTCICAQQNFEGTLHYKHEISYEDSDAQVAHRKAIKELRNTQANPQLAMLKSGELAHRRSYTILPDRLLSTIRDKDGKKILEYRVQQPNYAFRVDHSTQTVTNPRLVVENREKTQKPKKRGFETLNGYDCEVYTIKYKGGELSVWVTDAIVLPTHVGYFSELVLNNKVIVRSVDHNKAEGRFEELSLAYVDTSEQVVSDADLTALEYLYKDVRTIERRMVVRTAGLNASKGK